MSAQAAARSSFYLAMRVLPKNQREAMFSIYRFCRAVDDVADEPEHGSPEQRLNELERWRRDIAAMYAGEAPAELADLNGVARRYGLRQRDFEAVIDGVKMDAERNIRAPDWATLDLYCDRVASAVGRLSVRIFGIGAETGEALAFHLGRALQLTNILRDIDEDAAVGRLYLPCEALAAARVAVDEPLRAVKDPKIAIACDEVARRARRHFEEADPVLASAPRAGARAPRLMSTAYRSLLDNMAARGFEPPRERAKPSRLRVLGALICYGVL
ncbi:MAG TPA: presqualene diphosphate synthase HpnD [Roseiarcus sp.]|jgi:phytoene synthase|nr:presqualene diphosphate synthase HpnD [Roseiarcus sp.]